MIAAREELTAPPLRRYREEREACEPMPEAETP